ncbi:glycosyltransferase family 4 protein [Belnapia sp. T6]|uniref:Glycosyltransferase family 4 protein n=1 Tax=Belnapia mucosa TaxID=2804532 RepID=A0ABS1V5P1_9PROT|nr:glycosyltransferase family 4 protein [Belnapia mucosa]MBL6455618.1 glycosyltransferase family 4 protein [Belnapia mucosa]
MTIALLVPGPFATISGGYNYDRRLVEGLRALGETVEVVELAGRHPLPDAAAEAAARTALDRLPAEVRIVIDGLGLPAFAPLADALVARRAVALIHHPTALEGRAERREALRAIEAALLPRLARLIATSGLTARRLAADFGVEPARVGVVEPGTDPAPRARGSGGPGIALLSVGTLIPRKGHDVLLRALARLSDLDWRLTIAGAARDADCAAALRAQAEAPELAGRVTFAGEVEGAALEALYDGADAFVLASNWEGYGMALAEALARGLPAAVTSGGALAELLPLEAGAVSPPGDVVSLSKALRRLIFDHELRAEMAEAAWAAGQRLPRWADRAAAFRAELEQAG